MEYKPSKGFIEDIAKLALLCLDNDTDSMEIAFTVSDGRKAIVEMTFRADDADGDSDD